MTAFWKKNSIKFVKMQYMMLLEKIPWLVLDSACKVTSCIYLISRLPGGRPNFVPFGSLSSSGLILTPFLLGITSDKILLVKIRTFGMPCSDGLVESSHLSFMFGPGFLQVKRLKLKSLMSYICIL